MSAIYPPEDDSREYYDEQEKKSIFDRIIGIIR
jgi:hypothetical protein